MKEIIIHCAATPTGKDFTAKDIHGWHLQNGWDGIGYHYVIRIDGTVESGRPEFWTGSHAKGYNTGSIGICMIGTDSFSDTQWYSLKRLVAQMITKYQDAKVIGHNEISSKECPGFDVQEWMSKEFT